MPVSLSGHGHHDGKAKFCSWHKQLEAKQAAVYEQVSVGNQRGHERSAEGLTIWWTKVGAMWKGGGDSEHRGEGEGVIIIRLTQEAAFKDDAHVFGLYENGWYSKSWWFNLWHRLFSSNQRISVSFMVSLRKLEQNQSWIVQTFSEGDHWKRAVWSILHCDLCRDSASSENGRIDGRHATLFRAFLLMFCAFFTWKSCLSSHLQHTSDAVHTESSFLLRGHATTFPAGCLSVPHK